MSPKKTRPARHGNYIAHCPREYLDKDSSGFEKRDVDYMEGYGLFATEDFNNGDFLLNYRGKNVEDADSDPYVYQYMWDGGKRTSCIDARDENCGLGRYINDKDPHHPTNCKAVVTEFEAEGGKSSIISFMATSDIKTGETLIWVSCVSYSCCNINSSMN